MNAAKGAALTASELVENGGLGHNGNFWHGVQIYESDTALTKVASRFLGDGLQMGEGIIVVATAAHQGAFEEQLSAQGMDVPAARARGQYIPLDANELLTKFLLDGWPDPVRFSEMLGSVIRCVKYSRVRVLRAMVSVLWEAEQQAAAIRIEELWNDVLMAHPCSLLCAYPMAGFCDEVQAQAFLKVCRQHTHVLPGETFTRQDPTEVFATGSGETGSLVME